MVIPEIKNINPRPLLCTAVCAAIGFYFLSQQTAAFCITVLILSLAVMCLFRVLSLFDPQNRELRMAAVCGTACAAGLMLGICAAGAGRNDAQFTLPPEKIIAVEGVLLEDPRIITGGKAMVSLSLKRCAANGGLRAGSKGEITVFFAQENAGKLREFGRGTSVFAEGRLYLNSNSFSRQPQWTFSADSLHVVRGASAVERMRTGIRLDLVRRFDGKNWSALSLAMLVGIRDNLDNNLTDAYRSAGLSYILALSGMHLAVLAALIAFLLKKPLGLRAAAIAGAVIIVLYCFIVGPMPSLNRAALMYLLGTLAVLGALPKNSISILALSFLIQVIFSPSSGNTISFILSYLAMLGILIITKAIVSLFSGKIPDFLLQPLAVSCGAFLATAGVCSYTFGDLAPAGIIAGLIVVPATTVFMIGSIIFLVLDFFSFSALLDFPMSLLYQLMEKTAFTAGKLPSVSMNPQFILLLSIAVLLFIIIFENTRRKWRLRLQPFL
ncbi:MAG: ComEC/Rec2 family competence protein [Treponema sp.]|nr:ComEC/Rec2 family competence protein [Treponema sp.]MCL2271429.1 ComEC/Rec2 family competence protein [Treponema sp.]